jgi:hypothetical protein
LRKKNLVSLQFFDLLGYLKILVTQEGYTQHVLYTVHITQVPATKKCVIMMIHESDIYHVENLFINTNRSINRHQMQI